MLFLGDVLLLGDTVWIVRIILAWQYRA